MFISGSLQVVSKDIKRSLEYSRRSQWVSERLHRRFKEYLEILGSFQFWEFLEVSGASQWVTGSFRVLWEISGGLSCASGGFRDAIPLKPPLSH